MKINNAFQNKRISANKFITLAKTGASAQLNLLNLLHWPIQVRQHKYIFKIYLPEQNRRVRINKIFKFITLAKTGSSAQINLKNLITPIKTGE